MNKANLLKKVQREVALLNKRKKDPRYIRTVGFLVGKGFLHANRTFPRVGNIRIDIEDAIWAGKNVEPRILEVLPAAVIRLGKHFGYNPSVHLELKTIIEKLKTNQDGEFYGISVEKIRPWLNIPLNDRRVKGLAEKKVIKTFRLSPTAIDQLKRIKGTLNISESEVLEKLLSESEV